VDQERKVAIVTGAGQGLGAATAARLAGEGYRVIIAESDRVQAAQVAELIYMEGNIALACKADVADEKK